MSDKQETIADIIAEMRGMGNYQQYSGDNARALADRLEAAHRRELLTKSPENVNSGAASDTAGNSAKLREALKAAELGLFRWLSGSISRDEHRELVATIKTALAAPPRNCDIGTVEEQFKRLKSYCESHRDCVDCPVKLSWRKALSCGILWEQMPYEEGETDGSK